MSVLNKPIKVLVYVESFPAISETFVRDHIVGLIDEGCDVRILTAKYLNNPIALKDYSQYNLDKITDVKANIYHSSKVKRTVSFCLSIYKLFFSSHRKALRVTLNQKIFNRAAKNLSAFFIADYLYKEDFDIVHCHFGPAGNEMSLYRKVLKSFKLYVTFHGYDIRLGIKNPQYYKDYLENIDRVISISNYNKKNLLNFGFQESQILDIPNGINTSFFKCKEPYSLSNETLNFLSVGRLVKIKGFDVAIKAISRLKRENSKIKFTYNIIGSGAEKENLNDLLIAERLDEHVFLLGAKSRKVIKNYMCDSQIFILSSLEEALPTVLLEAQACGLPILSTNVGSVKRMLIKEAIVVKSNDVDSLYEGIKNIVDKKEQWSILSSKGIRNIEENFNLKKNILLLIEAYKKPL